MRLIGIGRRSTDAVLRRPVGVHGALRASRLAVAGSAPRSLPMSSIGSSARCSTSPMRTVGHWPSSAAMLCCCTTPVRTMPCTPRRRRSRCGPPCAALPSTRRRSAGSRCGCPWAFIRARAHVPRRPLAHRARGFRPGSEPSGVDGEHRRRGRDSHQSGDRRSAPTGALGGRRARASCCDGAARRSARSTSRCGETSTRRRPTLRPPGPSAGARSGCDRARAPIGDGGFRQVRGRRRDHGQQRPRSRRRGVARTRHRRPGRRRPGGRHVPCDGRRQERRQGDPRRRRAVHARRRRRPGAQRGSRDPRRKDMAARRGRA